MAGPITDMQWPRYAGVTRGWVAVHVSHAFPFHHLPGPQLNAGMMVQEHPDWMMAKQAETATTPHML